jgi:hypothetical protein
MILRVKSALTKLMDGTRSSSESRRGCARKVGNLPRRPVLGGRRGPRFWRLDAALGAARPKVMMRKSTTPSTMGSRNSFMTKYTTIAAL